MRRFSERAHSVPLGTITIKSTSLFSVAEPDAREPKRKTFSGAAVEMTRLAISSNISSQTVSIVQLDASFDPTAIPHSIASFPLIFEEL
jgi:hypothetical protein